MRIVCTLLILMALTAAPPAARSAAAPAPARTVTSFDPGWRFLKGDAPGAEKPDFADAAWRTLAVPHDWSIEGPFAQTNPTGGAGAYLPAGVGWYRKSFTLPASDAARRVFIEFDGVMANSDVWINGFHLGRRPYGYSSFRYEMTGHLNFGEGKTNLLAVRADNSQEPASRWYAGAGIYRHVRLIVTDPVHIAQWGTFVATPKVTATEATVHVQTIAVNQGDAAKTVALQVALFKPNGQSDEQATGTPHTLAAGTSTTLDLELPVPSPKLWELEQPNLYRVAVALVAGGAPLDDETVTFGIREAKFVPETGFWLNGKNMKILGVCLHQDAGGLGVAVPLGAWERRLKALKELGVNAIRTAHNPPDPGFLDLCDRMGLLVMDEAFDCWMVGKNRFDYHLYFKEWSTTDVADMVRRDRNHPSVIIYSIGNEIHDTPRPEQAKPILVALRDACHKYDTTRPVTQALFRPNASHDYDNGLADLLDVVGQNYRENEILAAHAAKPSRMIIGTENTHGASVWLPLRDNKPYAGQFLWTGIDYLGEAGFWPRVGAGSGLLDRTGALKPMGMERASWWATQPVVYMVRRTRPSSNDGAGGMNPLQRPMVQFPDWTPANTATTQTQTVEVYSNCEQVELSLNGKSLGAKPLPPNAAPRVWQVPFEKGALKAVGLNKGQAAATQELRTAGAPAKIALSADRPSLTPDFEDVACVTATVTDKDGVPIPNAMDLITFKLSGPGAIAAVDNADNSSHELFQASARKAYYGQCVAMVKASAGEGKITLSASAPGLAEGSVTIQATAAVK